MTNKLREDLFPSKAEMAKMSKEKLIAILDLAYNENARHRETNHGLAIEMQKYADDKRNRIQSQKQFLRELTEITEMQEQSSKSLISIAMQFEAFVSGMMVEADRNNVGKMDGIRSLQDKIASLKYHVGVIEGSAARLDYKSHRGIDDVTPRGSEEPPDGEGGIMGKCPADASNHPFCNTPF